MNMSSILSVLLFLIFYMCNVLWYKFFPKLTERSDMPSGFLKKVCDRELGCEVTVFYVAKSTTQP